MFHTDRTQLPDGIVVYINYYIQESVKGGMENHLKIEHSVKDDVIKVMINNIKEESNDNMVQLYFTLE